MDRSDGFTAASLIACDGDDFHLVFWVSGFTVVWFFGYLVLQLSGKPDGQILVCGGPNGYS
jgi:hypothetical protein